MNDKQKAMESSDSRFLHGLTLVEVRGLGTERHPSTSIRECGDKQLVLEGSAATDISTNDKKIKVGVMSWRYICSNFLNV